MNITIHISDSKLRIIDKFAKSCNISRNKIILSCIEYAIEKQDFIDEILENASQN